MILPAEEMTMSYSYKKVKVKLKKYEDKKLFRDSSLVKFIGNLRINNFCSTMVLKFYCASESLGGLAKPQIVGLQLLRVFYTEDLGRDL